MVCSDATEKTSSHRIIVDNVNSGETLSYSLFICKGHIENVKDLKCTLLSHMLIQTINNDSPQQVKISSTSSSFKFLVNLNPGRNNLYLFYCCTSTSITVEYKPRDTTLKVLPLYIICKGHSGRFQAPEAETNTPESACKRIITGCRLIQSLFAEKLHESGLGRKTFQLETSECLIFHSQLHFKKASQMGQLELWYYFAREIMSSHIGSNERKYLAFLSCTWYDGSKYSEDIKDHGEIIKLTNSYVAFGGEGLALLGTACLYTWPQCVMEVQSRFEDDSAVDRTRFMDDSCYRGTLGGCFSTTLGATLHELCHTFDLGHSDDGVMGRGFDNIQNVFLPNVEDSISTCNSKTDKSFQANFRLQRFTHRHKKNDATYWTENCIVLLNYHRWFNNFSTRRKCLLHYDANTKVLKSTAGLRVIEIRREPDEIVLKHWIFLDKVLKYSHQIDDPLLKSESDIVLVVEDNNGNILKQNI